MRRVLLALAIAAVAATGPRWGQAAEAEDEAIAQEIAANLKSSRRMQSYKIGVAYKDGTAWLNGNVASKEQLQNALQIVRETEGVEDVVNRISIEPGSDASSNIRLAGVQAPMSKLAASARQSAARPKPTAARGAMPASYARMNGPAMDGAGAPVPAQGVPAPAYMPGMGGGVPMSYDQPYMPNYSWPSYASYPNYAALTYPRQYSPTAWPYIGPFYPYPQVPLGWRKVTLEWDDGWWFLDFKEH
jgi:hypothetical protein